MHCYIKLLLQGNIQRFLSLDENIKKKFKIYWKRQKIVKFCLGIREKLWSCSKCEEFVTTLVFIRIRILSMRTAAITGFRADRETAGVVRRAARYATQRGAARRGLFGHAVRRRASHCVFACCVSPLSLHYFSHCSVKFDSSRWH